IQSMACSQPTCWAWPVTASGPVSGSGMENLRSCASCAWPWNTPPRRTAAEAAASRCIFFLAMNSVMISSLFQPDFSFGSVFASRIHAFLLAERAAQKPDQTAGFENEEADDERAEDDLAHR